MSSLTWHLLQPRCSREACGRLESKTPTFLLKIVKGKHKAGILFLFNSFARASVRLAARAWQGVRCRGGPTEADLRRENISVWRWRQTKHVGAQLGAPMGTLQANLGDEDD